MLRARRAPLLAHPSSGCAKVPHVKGENFSLFPTHGHLFNGELFSFFTPLVVQGRAFFRLNWDNCITPPSFFLFDRFAADLQSPSPL